MVHFGKEEAEEILILNEFLIVFFARNRLISYQCCHSSPSLHSKFQMFNEISSIKQNVIVFPLYFASLDIHFPKESRVKSQVFGHQVLFRVNQFFMALR